MIVVPLNPSLVGDLSDRQLGAIVRSLVERALEQYRKGN